MRLGDIVWSLLRGETPLTRLVLAVGFLGLVIVGAWGWLAAGTLPPGIVGLATAVLAAAYGGLLVVLVGTAVQRATRDQESTVLEMRRRAESGKRLAIYDQATGLYHRWYFELRLSEETKRCQRFGLSMALLAIKAQHLDHELQPVAWDEVNSNLALQVSRLVRAVDIPATIGHLEYALCLTQCDRAGAEATVERVLDALRDHSPSIGLAVYPQDGADGKELLNRARERAQPALQARSA